MQNLQSLQNLRNLGKSFATASTPLTYYSLDYDGTNDRSTIASSNSYQGLAAGTVEFFFNTNFGGAYQKFFKKDGVLDIGISQNFGGGAKVFAEVNGVKNVGEFTPNVEDGLWHWVAVSWNASTIEAYFDGTRSFNDTSDGAQLTSSNIMNVGFNGTDEFLNGNLYQVRFSSSKRYTGASVTVPSAPFTTDANTAILIPMTEGTGLTAADTSGNGNNLSLNATNPPTWSTDLPY